jgi:hypothetical protein
MHQMRISTNQVSSVILGLKNLKIHQKKNCENSKRAEKKTPKNHAMKLSMIIVHVIHQVVHWLDALRVASISFTDILVTVYFSLY